MKVHSKNAHEYFDAFAKASEVFGTIYDKFYTTFVEHEKDVRWGNLIIKRDGPTPTITAAPSLSSPIPAADTKLATTQQGVLKTGNSLSVHTKNDTGKLIPSMGPLQGHSGGGMCRLCVYVHVCVSAFVDS